MLVKANKLFLEVYKIKIPNLRRISLVTYSYYFGACYV